MKTDPNDKQGQILEAAIRRFSHFGVHKTTMTEIADDVALSKQALAYYFADKPSLIIAVVNLILDDYIEELAQNCRQAATVADGLLQLTELKRTFFERYYMLYLQTRNADLKIGTQEILNIRNKVRTREQDQIASLLSRGVERGEIKQVDVQETSALILETLGAFECSLKLDKLFPDHQDFLELIKKQKAVLHLFINGLKDTGTQA